MYELLNISLRSLPGQLGSLMINKKRAFTSYLLILMITLPLFLAQMELGGMEISIFDAWLKKTGYNGHSYRHPFKHQPQRCDEQ